MKGDEATSLGGAVAGTDSVVVVCVVVPATDDEVVNEHGYYGNGLGGGGGGSFSVMLVRGTPTCSERGAADGAHYVRTVLHS